MLYEVRKSQLKGTVSHKYVQIGLLGIKVQTSGRQEVSYFDSSVALQQFFKDYPQEVNTEEKFRTTTRHSGDEEKSAKVEIFSQ